MGRRPNRLGTPSPLNEGWSVFGNSFPIATNCSMLAREGRRGAEKADRRAFHRGKRGRWIK
jgi:hypothetical protein